MVTYSTFTTVIEDLALNIIGVGFHAKDKAWKNKNFYPKTHNSQGSSA